MKTRKTKKRNIIRRAVAFLLCMTMVLGLGMQDVIEQVYAEEASAVSREQSADVPATQEVESTETTTPEGETDPTASEETGPATPEEEPTAPEEDKKPAEPTNPTETEGNTEVTTPPTETTDPSAPEEPTTPADGTENTETDESTDLTAPETPADSNGSESSDETTPGEGTETEETPDQEVPADPADTTGEEEIPEEELPEEEKPYEAELPVGNVTIHVSAEPGVLPEDAELSVTPIVKTEITDDMSEEDKAIAEKINAQYDFTEKKLNEASEENEETIEGFLAYDISFLVDGEEIEPTGNVEVFMDFKEAAIPEGVSEDAEVSVKHLKEDETADDGVVVEDVTEDASVETTEIVEVETVTLSTESFSTFVIQWGSYKNKVTIHYVNANGGDITAPNAPTEPVRVDSEEWVELDEYAVNIEGYTYLGAHLNQYSGEIASEISYNGEDWYYQDLYGERDRWRANKERRVYLVYQQEIKVHFVSGADGSELKNSMSLEEFFQAYGNGETADLAPEFDNHRFVKTMIAGTYNEYEGTPNDHVYWALRLRENNGQYQYNRARFDGASDNGWLSINNQVYFIYKPDNYQITTRNSNDDGITLNLFNYDNTIKTEAEAAGFPFYNGQINHVDGKTGSPDTGGDVKVTLGADGYPVSANNNSLDFLFGDNPMPANYLFTYDESTYSYEYDSQRNHALYDEDADRFYVYDYRLSPAADSGYGDFQVGNFFPFNDTINPRQGELNYIQYGRDPRSNVDYWFGMSMNMNFYQPEDGRLPNGEAMKFEFRGDDDVFVYLDGVLILDLGGIHAAQSGSIDFSTGTIVENGETIPDGIYNRYRQSGLFSEDELNDIFTEITISGRKYHIFSDYYNAKMDFFYLERGAGASNCHIKFNMPPIPQDTIIVGKQITDANASIYSDVEFSFTLEIKDGDTWETVDSGPVGIYNAAGTFIENRNIENGTFKLKHGERAHFSYPANTVYHVTETGVSIDEYYEVEITGVEVAQIDSGGGTQNIKGYRTEDLVVFETPMVIFRNRIAAGNKKTLSIKKHIADNVDGEQYSVQVFLGDEALKEDGIPYNGKYWMNETEYTATNGVIQLQNDQTASIVDIPSGTSFKVVETGLNSDTYIDPIYEIDYADEISTGDAASGKLVLEDHTTVTITNAKKDTPDAAYIQVQKTFEGLTKEDVNKLKAKGDFAISLYTDPSCTGTPDVELKLSDSDVTVDETGLIYTWKVAVPQGKIYYVKEKGQEVLNYKVDSITVNGEPLEDDGYIDVELATILSSYELDVQSISEIALDNPVSEMPELIVGKFADEEQYLVWTKDTLSLGERNGILNSIKSEDNSFNSASIENSVFFSGEEMLSEGIAYQGIILYYTPAGQATINLYSPEKWDAVAYGTYTESSGSRDAEIEVINKYVTEEIVIDLKKYGTDYEAGEKDGAIFKLSRKTVEGGSSNWIPVENYQEITVSKKYFNELKLPAGIYKLEEVQAPAGCRLLDEGIYFKVEGTTVTLVKENGDAYGPVDELPTMWEIDANNGIVLKIKNDVLYDLPSAGGPGIYLYMLGGTMLMMAGALLVYKKRKEEVLRS